MKKELNKRLFFVLIVVAIMISVLVNMTLNPSLSPFSSLGKSSEGLNEIRGDVKGGVLRGGTEPVMCYVCDVRALNGATCFGDADGNGVVNAGDRGYVAVNIGQTENDLVCKFDMDGNGFINAGDRGFVAVNIGLCTELPDYQNGNGVNGWVYDPRFDSLSCCGNRVCEESNGENSENCLVDCDNSQPVCGNGEIEGDEQCDDGAACADGTPCMVSSECVGIGEGICEPRSGDGCSSECLNEFDCSIDDVQIVARGSDGDIIDFAQSINEETEVEFSTSCVGDFEYEWNFGSCYGSGGWAEGSTASYTFSLPGTQTVELKIKDSSGNVLDTRSVNVVTTWTGNGLQADFKVYELIGTGRNGCYGTWEEVTDLVNDEFEEGERIKFSGVTSRGNIAFYELALQNTAFRQVTSPIQGLISIGEKVGVFRENSNCNGDDCSSVHGTFTVYATVRKPDYWTSSSSESRIVFVSEGMRLLDYSDHDYPPLIPSKLITEGNSLWMFTINGELGWVDVSNPYSLGAVDLLDTDVSNTYNFAVGEGYAFVRRGSLGVDVYTHQENGIIFVGRIGVENFGNEAVRDLYYRNGHLFASVGDQGNIYSLSVECSLSGCVVSPSGSIDIDGTVFYVDGSSTGHLFVTMSGGELAVVNIRDPTNMDVVVRAQVGSQYRVIEGVVSGSESILVVPTSYSQKLYKIKFGDYSVLESRPNDYSSIDYSLPSALKEEHMYLVTNGYWMYKYNVADYLNPYYQDGYWSVQPTIGPVTIWENSEGETTLYVGFFGYGLMSLTP